MHPKQVDRPGSSQSAYGAECRDDRARKLVGMRIGGAALLFLSLALVVVGLVASPDLVARLLGRDGSFGESTLVRLAMHRTNAVLSGVLLCAVAVGVVLLPRLVLAVGSRLCRLGRQLLGVPARTAWSNAQRFAVSIREGQRWGILLTLALILLVGLALRVNFYVGLVRTDSFWTTASAHSLTTGDPSFGYSTYYGRSRRFLIYGTALLFLLFGESGLSASLLPIACSLATIVFLFLIGRKLWSAKAGLLAAGIYALAPPDIAISSFLLPDPVLPFFLSAALFSFLKGRELSNLWKRRAFLFAGGGLIASSFLVRENGPVAIGILGMYWILFDRRRWRDYAVVSVGFGLILGLILYIVRDDLALYFGRMFISGPPGGRTPLVYEFAGFLRILLSDWFLFPIYIPTLVLSLAGIRAAWHGRREDGINGIGLVVAWFLWLYLYLDFIGRYLHGFGATPRYTSILLPAAALLLAWGIERVVKLDWFAKRRTIRLGAALVFAGYLVFALGSGYVLVRRAQVQYYNVNYHWREPARHLGTLDPLPIYFLGRQTWSMSMSFFLGHRWPDVPYYVQATGGEYVYPGVKPEYLGKVEALQEGFREWRRRYVMDDPGELASLGPEIHEIEDAYVLVNPSTLATLGLDYLIPDDWQVRERFQECRNWRDRDRILYYAPERDILPDSDAWIADGLRSVERGDLEQALRELRFAVMLDPESQAARQLHEAVRLQLLSEGGESDELDVALLQAGTRIGDVKGELVNPLYNVAQALTLPRENRWITQHYCYFDGENELPIAVTLEFEQPRTIHNLEIQWKDYPSYVGSAWEAYGDRGDGSWSLIGRVHVEEDRLYELGLREATEFTRIKLLVTAISEPQRSGGIRIERIIIR